MKHLLYISHTFHQRTRSNVFLQEMLKKEYELEVFTIDPQDLDPYKKLDTVKRKNYDVAVFFQLMPSIHRVKRHIYFKQGVFFPMYDYYAGCMTIKHPLWAEYSNFIIINFSKTLHDDLTRYGFCSKYIQYFPEPMKDFEWGDEKSAFFWQRIGAININTVAKTLKNFGLKKLHIHQAVDPGEKIPELEDAASMKDVQITTTTWFENRDDIYKHIGESALYIAPRSFEGIGMSFLEAMAMGRCVVAVDHPTMNEYIVHGKTGLLYSSTEDPETLPVPENIPAVQKAAFEYIKDGYARWEREKFKILEWISGELQVDREKLKHTAAEMQWGGLPFLKAEVIAGKIQKIKKFVPEWLWNILRKSYRSFLGKDIKVHEKDVVKLYLFGILPVGKMKTADEGRCVRIEILGIPVYEENRKGYGYWI